MNKIKFIKLSENAVVPTRGSEQAAGYDLYAAIPESVVIDPHSTVMITTDLAIALPEGTFGGIYARSGLATKYGLRPANCTGVIDADYRGVVMVALHNDTDIDQIVSPKERIAQLVVQPYISCEFELAETLDDTKRGDGGFGSTGSH